MSIFRGWNVGLIGALLLCALFWFFAPLVITWIWREPQGLERTALGLWVFALLCILNANALHKGRQRLAVAISRLGCASAIAGCTAIGLHLWRTFI